MPVRNIAQINTIKIINDYLKWHNLSIKWNETGVCNGLATVHAQYTLAGKEDVFFKMLHRITDMSAGIHSESETHDPVYEDVDHFIGQVVLAYDPHSFENNLTQSNAYKTLKVDGKAIETDFTLPLVTSKNNWQQIFKELDLQTGEVVKVDSPTHAISIHKSNGHYVVFDPNYPEGKKIIQTEQGLLDELNKNVFRFSGTNLAMTLAILKKEGTQTSSTRRTAAEICKDYLKTPEDLNAQASYGAKSITNINLAVKRGDKEMVEAFLAQKDNWDAKELQELAKQAALSGNIQGFEPVFNKLQSGSNDSDIYKDIIEMALISGNKEIFDQIIQTESGKEGYKAFLGQFREYTPHLNAAVMGGNPDLITTLINDIKQYERENPGKKIPSQRLDDFLNDVPDKPQPFSMAPHILGPEHEAYAIYTIQFAIEMGKADCLDRLLNELKKEGHYPSTNQQKDYLVFAIKQNDIRMVDSLLKHMKPEQIPSITEGLRMSVHQAEKTNLHILNKLQNNGAKFSSAVKNVMKEKALHQLGMTEVLGVKLVAFVEYVQIGLGLKEHLSIDKTSEFKQRYQAQKENAPNVAPPEDLPLGAASLSR